MQISAYFLNNDGSKTALMLSNLIITYENGELPTVKDNLIVVKADDFSVTLPISVKKADYDMSEVRWQGEYQVYDGEEKYAYLTGLPEGVEVISYGLNSGVSAGSYKLSANLSYDKDNYNPPIIPDGWLVIDKKEVALPQVSRTFVYNGLPQAPEINGNGIYNALITKGAGVGLYKITLRLCDSENYRFKDDIYEFYYEITPRKITLKINPDGKSYTVISGSVIEGDDLKISYEKSKNIITILSGNPNYSVKADPFEVEGEVNFLGIIAFVFGVTLLLLLLSLYLVRKRRLRALLVSVAGASRGDAEKSSKSKIESAILAVDEAHANYLLTDSMAKGLLKRDDEIIKTQGRGWGFVNVDTISRSFNSGDVVDINSMKEKGIIPRSVLSVKVLGGGIIDKPLTVKANKFSASAIKMIALTGGEARKSKTARKKKGQI